MKLLLPKPDSSVKRLGVESARKNYIELAHQMTSILQGEIYRCPVCGEWYNVDKFYKNENFSMGFFPICKECLLDLATDYDAKVKRRIDNRTKTIRVFSMLDIPFFEEMYKTCLDSIKNSEVSRGKTAYQQMLASVLSLPQFKQMRFSDSSFGSENDLGYEFETNRKARREIKKLFGAGYTEGDYLFLQDQFDDFRARTQVDSKSQEIYVTEICKQLLEIDKDRKAGKDVTKKLAALDSFMASAKLQPKQNVNNAATDSLTMGQMIEKFENERPIPEPDPEFRDVNKIGKYIRVWFSGWLAKAMGFKNVNSKEFDDYVKQYEVENPLLKQDEESEEIYSTLFGKEEG